MQNFPFIEEGRLGEIADVIANTGCASIAEIAYGKAVSSSDSFDSRGLVSGGQFDTDRAK